MEQAGAHQHALQYALILYLVFKLINTLKYA